MDLYAYVRFIFAKKSYLETDRYDSVFDIDYDALKKKGVRLLIFDVDETLCPNGEEIPKRTLIMLTKLSKEFKVSFLSNCSNKRDDALENMVLGIEIYNERSSKKPGTFGFCNILSHFRISPKNAVMIGDKLSMDMFGAREAGIAHRILIRPYSIHFNNKGRTSFENILRKIKAI